jgi:hypothetical protein
LFELADRRRRQVRQQLRQISLRIDVVPTAGAGQTRQDRRSVQDHTSFCADFTASDKELPIWPSLGGEFQREEEISERLDSGTRIEPQQMDVD